jgi:hypothetical protein
VSDRLLVKKLTSASRCASAPLGCADFPVDCPIFSSALGHEFATWSEAWKRPVPINRPAMERQSYDCSAGLSKRKRRLV